MSCKHGVETLCATCINDAMCDAIREEGRLAGIREAIAIVAALPGGLDRGPLLSKLQALLPPPSGGEKVVCTTCGATDPLATPTCSNGFHAPKSAAEVK